MLPRKIWHPPKRRAAAGIWVLIALGIGAFFQFPVSVPVQKQSIQNNPQIPMLFPKVADAFQNSLNSSFNASEVCKREYSWSNLTVSNVNIDAPDTYNSSKVDVCFYVLNATLNASTIVNFPGGTPSTNRSALAQSFEVTTNSFLYNISLYFSGTANYPFTLEIRKDLNGYPNGTALNTTAWTPSSAGWQTFNYFEPIFLEQGRYFVCLSQSDKSPKRAWVDTVSTDYSPTFYYSVDTGHWTLAPFDLTLNITLRSVLNSSNPAINLRLENKPVQYLGDGYGEVTVSKQVTSSTVTFTVESDANIIYSYQVNATYYRNTTASNIQISFENLHPVWNVTLPLSDPKTPYADYLANVTGFQDDYSAIQVYNGSDAIGSELHLSEGYILLTSEANQFTFESENYITGIECPSEIYGGTSTNINVSVHTYGNVTLEIYSGIQSVYWNSSMCFNTASFYWDIGTSYYGDFSIQVYYTGFNQVGSNQTTIMIKQETFLSVGEVFASALDNVTIQGNYSNILSNPILEASVQFNLGSITGIMNYNSISHNYTSDLNLDAFALTPGTYSLNVTTDLIGYRSRSVEVPFHIEPRPLRLTLARSTTLVRPGEVIEFTITAGDLAHGSFLLRPVNIKLSVYPVGGNATLDAIMSEIIIGVSLQEKIQWTVPSGVNFGAYDIAVEVSSAYYAEESLVISSGLTIEPALNFLLYGSIVAGLVIVSSGAYVQRKKVESKRSVKGLMILQKKGASVKERISPSFSNKDPLLISGAIIGLITLLREITGSGLRTIVVEGGYIQFTRGSSFWVITLLRKNPKWIKGTIQKMVGDIEARYGKIIDEWKGENINMDLDAIVKQHFGVTLEAMRELNLAEFAPKTNGQVP